jgi:hypothetical protein
MRIEMSCSQAYEILESLGGDLVRYTPRLGGPRTIMALVEPMRKTDELGGRQSFLTKTYDVWIVRDATEGMATVSVNVDQLALKLLPGDTQETVLKITKILPERESGSLPNDGVGMWHLEAVA